MKAESTKSKVRVSGRYFREKIERLFLRIHEAGKRTMKLTESERAVRLIQNSLDRDFKEGFRKREHGQDAYQIAEAHQAKIADQIQAEQDAQEAEYLAEVIEVLRETLSAAEMRKAEIDSGRGTVLFLERRRHLAEAQARIQKAV